MNKQFARYESYKDSDVEWLGQLPTSWYTLPIKAIFIERKEQNIPIKTTEILSLSMNKGVTLYSEKEGGGGNKAKEDLTAYKIAHPNDIVLNSMNVIVGSVGLSKYYGAVSPVYYTIYIRNKNFYNINYFDKVFQNPNFQMSLFGLGNGILIKKSESSNKLNTIRMRIPMEKLNKVLLAIPPIEEQQQIADFLDQKTAQIDEAIAGKEKMIELLKEYRQVTINNAVTKGLDPNVPMKDSGIEWLGQIPAHWKVNKAKYELKKLSRKRVKNDVTVVCSNSGKSIIKDEGDKGLISLTQHDYQGVAVDDIMIHGMDTWHGAIALSEFTGDCTSVVHICDTKNNKNFIVFYLQSLAYNNIYKLISNGVRQNTSDFRSWLKFGEVSLLVPPISEQHIIANHIKSKIKTVDFSISLKQSEIEKLKEYKATLIDSAVTGKIKV